jgi:HEAT repeat protein
MLIRVGASWCAPCRKLAAEIEKPSVQAELARWTPVYLDADKAEEEVAELNVTTMPALRIRTMLGEPVAAADTILSAEDLVSWLRKQYEAASAEADEVLLTDDEPDAAAVVRLIRQFRQRNPAIREAAVRRLAPYPQKARVEVVQAFAEGGLARQLAALELLRQWRAPVADLDPWQPQSLTKERLAALNSWAEKFKLPEGEAKTVPGGEAKTVPGSKAKTVPGGEAKTVPGGEAKKLAEQDLVEARRDIDRMLKANPGDVEAIRDRLAACGPALLPEITARLKETAADELRQRLWALRYRLVASDSLVLRWPGGLERLAATDPRRRQQAADELARLATVADQPLLVELFSDNDPLVREFSLRALQNIGGQETTAALVKLLADPEPNVRAAVLKQLEEKPDVTIVPKLANYLKTEKDADLVVHAIRFLQAAGGSTATRALIPLLRHESWQVRAEACEALGKIRENDRFGNNDESGEKLQAEVYAAMLDLLGDTDAFVVSRAVEGLSRADMVVAVEPLVRAAGKHPDLAPKIVAMLAEGQKMRIAALSHLRKFRKHDNPLVRAAAMGMILPGDTGDELAVGLQDPSDKVRIATARVLFQSMEGQRSAFAQQLRQQGEAGGADDPFGAGPMVSPPAETSIFSGVLSFFNQSEPAVKSALKSVPARDDSKLAEKSDAPKKPGEEKAKPPEPKAADEDPYDVWLKEYYAGKRRPRWAVALIGPLEKMLPSKNVDERLAAALALVPLGKAQVVLPLFYEAARSDPAKYREAAEVLRWLVWQERLPAFRQLRAIAATPEAVGHLVESMAEVRDRRAAALFWELLADAKTVPQQGGAIEEGLLSVHGINRWYSRSDTQSAALKKALLELGRQAKPKAASGSDLQRLVALGLLAYADPGEAVQVAEKLQADTTVGAALRNDAFHVMLVTAPPKDAVRAALAAIAGKDAARRKMALGYLVYGPSEFYSVRNTITVPINSEGRSVRSGTPIVPKPPEGLPISQVVPLLDDPDPAVAAEAGYLLALMGEARGLEPLLRYAQQQGKSDSSLQRLAYRAIAVLDDSNQISLLKKIYAGLSQYEVSEFYWTIRIMTGPEILKFRKQIRDEVGMNQLQ